MSVILQIPNVSSDEADTYKCYARNEFGKAVCTVMLNIIEGMKQNEDIPKHVFYNQLNHNSNCEFFFVSWTIS